MAKLAIKEIEPNYQKDRDSLRHFTTAILRVDGDDLNLTLDYGDDDHFATWSFSLADFFVALGRSHEEVE